VGQAAPGAPAPIAKGFSMFSNLSNYDFEWLNKPSRANFADGRLSITTEPNTDFWQRTHYGFRNDNGHALLAPRAGDFQIRTHASFQPRQRYDQCGLLIRIDPENWIKFCTEYETAEISMLGSVVTNLGYSDWATTELDGDPGQAWYQISKNGADFLLQVSFDGKKWEQQRITHLHAPTENVLAGIYACSPLDGRFSCIFDHLSIGENRWQVE
jgi:uncharacterized protein